MDSRRVTDQRTAYTWGTERPRQPETSLVSIMEGAVIDRAQVIVASDRVSVTRQLNRNASRGPLLESKRGWPSGTIGSR